jgi:UDP-4-amino-4,6-dideoxy-N-acetyl-beta-L-altrosamine N-acetyltransferase
MTEQQQGQYFVRRMEVDDQELVLAWRNHPEVRRYMYNQHEISLAEHRSWFARASTDPCEHLLIFVQNDVPCGYASIQEIDAGRVADWGFYVAPEAPRGTGRKLGTAVLDYAFRQLGLHKLCGQALGFNERSIRFHLAIGFVQEGVLRQQHFDGRNYQNVVCFGLLNSEWQQKK